eukprot:362392-Chlamydomonas_euryale.AAC.1
MRLNISSDREWDDPRNQLTQKADWSRTRTSRVHLTQSLPMAAVTDSAAACQADASQSAAHSPDAGPPDGPDGCHLQPSPLLQEPGVVAAAVPACRRILADDEGRVARGSDAREGEPRGQEPVDNRCRRIIRSRPIKGARIPGPITSPLAPLAALLARQLCGLQGHLKPKQQAHAALDRAAGHGPEGPDRITTHNTYTVD